MVQAVNDFFDDRSRRCRDIQPGIEAVDELCSELLGRHAPDILDPIPQCWRVKIIFVVRR